MATSAQLVAKLGEETAVKILTSFVQKAEKRVAKKKQDAQDKVDYASWVKAGKPGLKR